MEKFFRLKEHGTDVRTEVMAGLTTFMAMAYILMVNANMFANPFSDGTDVLGVSYGAIYIATAISAIIGTVLVGLLANLPLAMASGMGLNAFFVYTVCVGMGFTYANALLFVLLDGIVFLLLSITGMLDKIFDAIPKAVRQAIPAAIGLYIAFIGMQNAGIIVNNDSTLVSLASFNVFAGSVTSSQLMSMGITFIGLLVIAVFSQKNIKGAVIWGIVISTIVYYLAGFAIDGFYDGFFDNMSFDPIAAFRSFGSEAVGVVLTQGFDFSGYLQTHSTTDLVVVLITTSLAFCLVDMFDTLGTLFGACARGNMLTEDGKVPHMDKAMFSDAVATCTGALLGTSTVTTFLESAAGVGEGGRTGLASMVTGALFFVAMFLSPVAQLIPTYATAAALIYVGVLMMNCVRDIEWTDITVAVPAFLTIALMSFAYNISYGIGIGIISYTLIAVCTGKTKEIKPLTWVICILFAVMFLSTH